MIEIILSTLHLYQNVLHATIRSFRRGWLTILAIVGFAGAMFVAMQLAAPLGIAGGFIIGAANALFVGAFLSLVEQSVKGTRSLAGRDLIDSIGHYFWDVISVGFILWVPLLVLEKAATTSPETGFLAAAVLLLLFILLNPAPEVIYQVRHDSPLDVLKTSYEFVIENWIEWFLPLAVVLAPLGLTFFFTFSRRLGGGAGLNFLQLLSLPFLLLSGWLAQIGVPEGASTVLVLVLTPPLVLFMMFFRGHLFAALQGSSRRQRLFQEGSREQR